MMPPTEPHTGMQADPHPQPDPQSFERRAVAAERTVEVLKTKVHDLYNGGTSALQRQLEKAQRREENNRRKRELVEMRAAELKRYSEGLEAEVARRTEAIKTILDNVTFGFLVVDRALVVQPECTKSCHRLFDAPRVEGENLCDLLALGERDRRTLLLGADQVFEDILPAEASIAQLRSKFTLKSGRSVRIEAGVVRGPDGAVTGLLLTVSDITLLEAATRESNDNRTLVGILKMKESFRGFLLEARAELEGARRVLKEGGAHEQSDARHVLHALKGNSASYGLDAVVDVIHEIEESLDLEARHIDQVAASLRAFLHAHEAVLELDFDRLEEEGGEEGFTVTREQMGGLRTLASSLHGAGATELKRWTARVLRKPAWQVLGPIDDFSRKLGERLGKSVSFKLTGGDFTVDVEVVRPVFQVVTHLIRNSVDHGIEAPVDRRGKPPSGRLELELVDRPQGYVLRCRDDGRGIDTDSLGRRAVDLGLIAQDALARMNDTEKLNLVFVEGLSSVPVTTSVSGRGVGMSAVKAAVERVGGKIDIQSAPGEGTTFTITIPKPESSFATTNATVS
jgi:two-component system chemotaxis sensor kinase CheA